MRRQRAVRPIERDHDVLVDETFAITEQAHHLTRLHPVGALTLRARAHRDAHQRQGHAVVEVLTPAPAWTQLAAEPTGAWYDASPRTYASPRLAGQCAEPGRRKATATRVDHPARLTDRRR
jgi:hypothetical protein